MFCTKALLSAVTAALFVGPANAFTGTAVLGFFETTNCAYGNDNGPFAIAIPIEGETTTAVFSGTYDAGGSDDIALSPAAFAALAGSPFETSLHGVTWAFI
ncbi:hypothetical protein K438DRAFT_1992897 [Mycena galopus ATCC 62051]|nr:hypothetical protein K438DRAFT_1992897 [Mycena galopus ATCC 62051]